MRRSKAIWGYEKEQLENWESDLTISKEYLAKYDTFKLCHQKEIIGFYSQRYQGQNLKLDNLFIDSEYVGSGYGSVLLKHFIDKAESTSNNKKVKLESDPNAENFYQKHNFMTVGLQKTSVKNRFLPIMMLARSSFNDIKLFESNRLYVRHLRQNDIKRFYEMQSNPNVMKYVKPHMNYEETQQELSRFINYYLEWKTMFRIWAVVDNENDGFVGICGVYLNEHSEFEIAYRLQEANWGKGFGKEIAESLINFCFETLDYDTLYAYVCLLYTSPSPRD